MKVTPRRARWFGRLGAAVVAVVGSTWRIRVHGHQLDLTRRDLLCCFLHGDMLIPAFLYRRTPAAIMISQHGDGEVIAQVVRRLGRHVPVRGSTTRGGARAFLQMVQGMGDLPWAITPDGPRGPRGSVHDGVILLAAESGRAIRAIGFAVSAAWRLRSWDRFVIPRPFARIAAHVGEQLAVPANVDRDHRRRIARELEARMRLAAEAAQRALDDW